VTKLKITRTITHESKTPFNTEYYPNMTLDEAKTYELNTDHEVLVEMLMNDEFTCKTQVEVIEE
jgi:hypothetical protein